MIATNGAGRKPRTVFQMGQFHADRDVYSDAIWNWRWGNRLIVCITAFRLTFKLRSGRMLLVGWFDHHLRATKL